MLCVDKFDFNCIDIKTKKHVKTCVILKQKSQLVFYFNDQKVA